MCGQTKAVSAEQLTEKVELTEEERYDPRYYRPFGKTDGTEGIDATGAAEVNGDVYKRQDTGMWIPMEISCVECLVQSHRSL